MRLSRYLLPTLRQAPADADNVSAALMQRAGMIRKLASGIYEWLPLGLRTLRKIERIVREEMDAVGGQEVRLPVVQPRELWEETGRWRVYGKELLRLKDRKGGEFCFAPTAEEVVTDLVRREVRSWRQLPLILYQFGLKFRDEIRPRFGVMRSREFYMKDAYSFHADDADASRLYKDFLRAYTRIFERCGLRFKPVEAQSGAIGGSYSHEFMALAETGEETIVSCVQCSYAANIERAECKPAGDSPDGGPPLPIEEVHTPGATSVEEVAKLLKASPKAFLKTQLYIADGAPVMALVRGDHELNEMKLALATGAGALERAGEAEYEKIAGCAVGYAGPVRLPRATPEGEGTRVRIIADFSLKGLANAVSGANQGDYHLRNINIGRDFQPDAFADLRKAVPQDPCPRCGGPTEFAKGIEVGHTFKLGTKYSEALEAFFLDAEQKSAAMVMGCYGIGVSRVVAAAIEQGHDDFGIIWPAAIAPFTACVVPVEHDDPLVTQAAEGLYRALRDRGIDALLDDRAERPGVRFKDIDLVGIPFRFIVSRKTLPAGEAEFKRRASKDIERWRLSEAPGKLYQIAA